MHDQSGAGTTSGVRAASISLDGTQSCVYAIHVGATFLTGVEVDMASALITSATKGPGASLEQHTTVPFRSSRSVLRRGDGSFYAVNGADHGTEIIPRAMATVDPGWVLSHCDLGATPAGWKLAMAECDLHDFGVGAVTLRWEPATPQDCTTQELKGVIEALHDASWTAVSSLITEVSLACQEALVNDPARLDLARGLAVENVAVLPPVGGALWLWHLLLISCPAATDHRALVDEVASVVCPNDHRVLHQRDHSFAAGVHASVACSVQGMESDATFLARALRTQDPWWTLFWRLDRVLLALQLRLESSLDKDDAAELKKRADLILEVSSRVDLLMSRLDSLLVASGARDIAAWEVLADAWGMPFRVGVVERKLVLLSRAYTEAVARISSNQSARVNFMIYVFTALSVVASVVAVADFAQGTNNSQIGVRLTIVLVSILAALVAVFLSIRTTRLVRARLRP